MIDPDSLLYRKAFENYLRKGISPEIYLKTAAETAEHHTTPHYLWRTQADGKVRPLHAANDRRVFSWDKPPTTGHPGQEPGCRCWAEPFRFNDAGGADILALLPIFRIPEMVAAWRAWLTARNASKTWQLSKTKSEVKWRNRIENGNWTPDKITQTLRRGAVYKVKNERTGGPATRYELNGQYVVRDDTTGDILQLSGRNHIGKIF